MSRGNRVKKKKMIKIKEFLRDNIEDKGRHNEIITKWTKIEVVIPTGMKYRWDNVVGGAEIRKHSI